MFSMVKVKFGDRCGPSQRLAKSAAGQVNEVLLQFLSHNLVVLAQAIRELEIGLLHLGRN